MTGLRPIIEGMNMGFLLLAYNQISNNAGMLHYTSGGQFKVRRPPSLIEKVWKSHTAPVWRDIQQNRAQSINNLRCRHSLHENEYLPGDMQVPIVIRGPGGVGRQLGAEHSQRLESYFQSIPGVQLVACSTVANAKALLKSAIRSDNPVIFFEHVLLYNVKGRLPASPKYS